MSDTAAIVQELQRLKALLDTTVSRVWHMHGAAAGAAAQSDKQMASTEQQLHELRTKVEPALKAWAEAEEARRDREKRIASLLRPVIVVPVVFLFMLSALIWGGYLTLQDFAVRAPGLELSGSSTTEGTP